MIYGHDDTAMTELNLYAENEVKLYGQFKSIIANIKRKIKAGKYDASKAPKLWMYWYDAAAKMYCKEHGAHGSSAEVRTMFPKHKREWLAKQRAKDEYEKILGGEYAAIPPTLG